MKTRLITHLRGRANGGVRNVPIQEQLPRKGYPVTSIGRMSSSKLMGLCVRSGCTVTAAWLGLLYAASGPESAGPGANTGVPADHPEALPVLPVPVPGPPALNQKRILKIIPDYQTVRDSSSPVAPLGAREKWRLGFKEAIDPFNIASAAITAAFSQHDNQTPSYGEGWANYGKRFGAAVADFGTQSILSAGLFANILHQDPRYFRKGSGYGVLSRALYSASRLFVCRSDAGKPVFNASNLLGMGTGIAVSNIYYPSTSRTGTVMASRIETSLFGSVTGNLLSEFWPDIQHKFFHKKTGSGSSAPRQ